VRRQPAPEVKARLLASIGVGRFEMYAPKLASVFDVTVDRARELLGLIERKASWESPIPGLDLSLIHFDGGPACATADCGFIRIGPKGMFPWHKHRGEELNVVLAGHIRCRATNRLFGPGDEVTFLPGTEHDLTVEGDEDGLVASRAFEGIEISGVRATKGS